jgi:hypothetical protein
MIMAAVPTKTIWVTLPTPYEPDPEELLEKYGVDRDLVVGTIRGEGRWIKKPRMKRDSDGPVFDDDGKPVYEVEGHGEFQFGFQVIGRPDRVAQAAQNAPGPYIDTDDITF